ncbi:MAG: DedA family protein [Verrucomicrobiales bacterium]|nr:DedA family protein [Verrucomicrobiales bacterium]
MSLFQKSISALLLTGLCFTLTACGPETSVFDHLSDAAELPLWQRVTAIALSTLISEDLACIAAGMLASEGAISFTWALIAAFLGIYFGDLLLYLLGRIGGLGLLKKPPFRWMIKESQVVQAETLFREHGAKLIFSSRLLPGSRLPIYAAAGVLNYPLWRFALFMFLAGTLSAFVLVGLSNQLGEVVFDWLKIYEHYAVPVFVAVVLIVYLTVKILEILATKRSRLVFLSRCRKIYFRFTEKPRRS